MSRSNSQSQRNTRVNAPRPTTIEEYITQNEERMNRAFEPSRGSILPPRKPSFFSDMKELHGSKQNIMNFLRLKPHLYNEMKKTLSEVDFSHKGKKGYIDDLEDRVLALLIYVTYGNVDMIRIACHRKLVYNSTILSILNSSVQKFRDVMVDQYITFENERIPNTNISTVIDCTIIPRERPVGSFKDAKEYFSGKHFTYCYKKEIVVNSVTGTCCFVSSAFPGSHHDMVLLRHTKDKIKDILNDSVMIADKGYVSIEKEITTAKVANEEIEIRNRQIVERFFGRLKKMFALMTNTFRLGEEMFDYYFDLCVCLTNIDISYRPLTNDDRNDYLNYQRNVKKEMEERREKKRIANEQYRQKRKEEMEDDLLLELLDDE